MHVHLTGSHITHDAIVCLCSCLNLDVGYTAFRILEEFFFFFIILIGSAVFHITILECFTVCISPLEFEYWLLMGSIFIGAKTLIILCLLFMLMLYESHFP